MECRAGAEVTVVNLSARVPDPLRHGGATAIINGLADYLTGPIPRNVARAATGSPRSAGFAASHKAMLLPDSSRTGVVSDKGPCGPFVVSGSGSLDPFSLKNQGGT